MALQRELARLDALLATGLRPAKLAAPELLASLATEHRAAATPAVPDDVRTALPNLARMLSLYGLSAFDRDLLLVAAAPEIDFRYADVLANASGTAQPTLGALVNLLVAAYGLPRDGALSRTALDAPLLRNALLELHAGADTPTSLARVRVPDPVWRRMIGLDGGSRFEILARQPVADLLLEDPIRAAFQRAVTWLRDGCGVAGPRRVRGPAFDGRAARRVRRGRPADSVGHARGYPRRAKRSGRGLARAASRSAGSGVDGASACGASGGLAYVSETRRALATHPELLEVMAFELADDASPYVRDATQPFTRFVLA